jgi:hypothetical protein
MSDIIQRSPKSFLARPEGKVGLAVTVLAAGIAGYGLYLALPAMIAFTTNLIHLAALCAVIGVVAYLVLDRRFRVLASYAYRAFFRSLTGLVVELDPIGILEAHIRNLQAKLVSVREQMGRLNGQIRHIERTMSDNEQMRDAALRSAKAGRQDGKLANATRMQARHAVKLEASNENLSSVHTRMQSLARMLKKVHDAAELVLQDMVGTVDVKRRERESIQAAYSAYRSAFAILKGQSEGQDLYDDAMEYLNQDYADKLGEIETFIDFSGGIIEAAELQNLADDARISEQLESWERRLGETVIDGSQSLTKWSGDRAKRTGDDLDAILDGPLPPRSAK